MKDPCLECLVRVTCSEECPDKKNYATLLSQGLQNFRGHGFDPRYRKQYENLHRKSLEHKVRRSMISSRKNRTG
jgi:hypothetical protein